MLTPQFSLSLHHELIVDLFAGGGGASTGIEMAVGRPPDIAINHDPVAISLHTANHPQTRHYCSDVFEVEPVGVCQGQPVGLLWASPDCKHFSKAKGGKPVSKKIRSLAGVVIKWIQKLKPTNQHPRMIYLENVEEFQTWGPLGEDNRPCPIRKGQTFQRWKKSIESLGYRVEHRELRACDFGTPTIRKRLFLIARRDGMPIVWPEPTHSKPNASGLAPKGLTPWKTAAECIDWSIPCPSIFGRKKPLADATCRRIAKGIMRYVVNAAEPFIVQYHSAKREGDHRTADLGDPLPTQTTENRFALAVPTLAQTGYGEREGQAPRALDIGQPIGTLVGSQKHALVTAFLAKHYTGVVGSDLNDPMGTVTSVDHHSLVTANLVHLGHGEGKDGTKRFSHGIRDITDPLNTITASGAAAALVTSHLIVNTTGHPGGATSDPLHTITTGGHHAEVRAFLVKYYGNEADGVPLTEPMHTLPTKDRMGLVTIHGTEYAIVDIGLRMLAPHELFKAQGFPANYIIDRGANGEPITKTAQVRLCGNSVCPPIAAAIVGANYKEMHAMEIAA